MNKRKELLVTSFALFSMFFGAGNLLLPPLLGYKAGDDWFWVTLGFVITAVVIPIFGILAHAKLQGTMYDFGKKVSHAFSIGYCVIVYVISVGIPSPRTAAATHEIAIYPVFGTSALLTSAVYFCLVLIFVLNRSKILNLIGKFLTPLIVVTLLLVIGLGLFTTEMQMNVSAFNTPVISGVLEGYQTFDAIGAVVVGAVIIVSLNLKNGFDFQSKKRLIKKAGCIAGLGLFVIYAGLIAVGAFYSSEINVDSTLSSDMQRSTLLRSISLSALGNLGNFVLSILIGLACFTTAIGITAGTADYFKGLFNNSQTVYVVVSVLSCVIGVLIGQLDFHTIIMIALPILMFIYPITIVLILLNVIPERYGSPLVFKAVVCVTFLFSIPDVLKFCISESYLKPVVAIIPLAEYNLGWLIPAFLVFTVLNLIKIAARKLRF